MEQGGPYFNAFLQLPRPLCNVWAPTRTELAIFSRKCGLIPNQLYEDELNNYFKFLNYSCEDISKMQPDQKCPGCKSCKYMIHSKSVQININTKSSSTIIQSKGATNFSSINSGKHSKLCQMTLTKNMFLRDPSLEFQSKLEPNKIGYNKTKETSNIDFSKRHKVPENFDKYFTEPIENLYSPDLIRTESRLFKEYGVKKPEIPKFSEILKSGKPTKQIHEKLPITSAQVSPKLFDSLSLKKSVCAIPKNFTCTYDMLDDKLANTSNISKTDITTPSGVLTGSSINTIPKITVPANRSAFTFYNKPANASPGELYPSPVGTLPKKITSTFLHKQIYTFPDISDRNLDNAALQNNNMYSNLPVNIMSIYTSPQTDTYLGKPMSSVMPCAKSPGNVKLDAASAEFVTAKSSVGSFQRQSAVSLPGTSKSSVTSTHLISDKFAITPCTKLAFPPLPNIVSAPSNISVIKLANSVGATSGIAAGTSGCSLGFSQNRTIPPIDVPKRVRVKLCEFCIRDKQPRHIFEGHNAKDCFGNITCPMLKKNLK